MKLKKINIFMIGFSLFFLLGVIFTSSQTITTKIDNAENCAYRWFCSNWQPPECPEKGIQKRECTNAGDCSDDYRIPDEKRGCVQEIPKPLFDIKLELEESVIYLPSKLVAWIRFENFGLEQIPVNLTYNLLDEGGNEFYSEEDFYLVETERFIIKRFDNLKLGGGDYTLVLTTLYDSNVVDEFRQEFEVKDSRRFLNYFLGVFLVFIVFYLIKKHTLR